MPGKDEFSMQAITEALPSSPTSKVHDIPSRFQVPTFPAILPHGRSSEIANCVNDSLSVTTLLRQNSLDSTTATFGSPNSTFADSSLGVPQPYRLQSVIVMRHSERLDAVDESWTASSDRPWDTPITEKGKELAYQFGLKLKSESWGLTRVVVSPFLRCVQTAAEVVRALKESDTQNEFDVAGDGGGSGQISELKVSIELGLSEMMNAFAIRSAASLRPDQLENAKWIMQLGDLLSLFPESLIDTAYTPIEKKMIRYGETEDMAHFRFSQTFDSIADKYPEENILFVTHGEAVSHSVSRLVPVTVYEVSYCAYSVAQRPIFLRGEEEEDNKVGGEWELLTEPGITGISWMV